MAIDARNETGYAGAVRVAAGTFEIQFDQPRQPAAIPARFNETIAAGLLYPGFAEGSVVVEVGGKQILAEAGVPLRLGRHGVKDANSCSYEPLTPLRHERELDIE